MPQVEATLFPDLPNRPTIAQETLPEVLAALADLLVGAAKPQEERDRDERENHA